MLYWPFIGAGVIALTLIVNIFRAKRIDLKSVFVMVMERHHHNNLLCLIKLLKSGIPTYSLFTDWDYPLAVAMCLTSRGTASTW